MLSEVVQTPTGAMKEGLRRLRTLLLLGSSSLSAQCANLNLPLQWAVPSQARAADTGDVGRRYEIASRLSLPHQHCPVVWGSVTGWKPLNVTCPLLANAGSMPKPKLIALYQRESQDCLGGRNATEKYWDDGSSIPVSGLLLDFCFKAYFVSTSVIEL